MEFTHLSLFSGIGGLDLAAEWAGFKTVGQCESADYPAIVLTKNWPNVPKWEDPRRRNEMVDRRNRREEMIDENSWEEYSAGIHFFITRQEAIDY